ncbi:MAG: PEGA domain-containing protein [Deltaproteobacteria bacterium]|nr:PEGA domain-containing protein [Deltaproteobacteria bacterium]
MDDKRIDWFVEETLAQPARRRRRFAFVATTLASAAGLALVAFAIGNQPNKTGFDSRTADSTVDTNAKAQRSKDAQKEPSPLCGSAPLRQSPAPAKLVVVATPRTARVTLNGFRPITTASAVEIRPGAHTLVATHPGFASTTLPIDAKPGEMIVRSIALRRLPPAKLFVTVHERGEPSWAHVFVDDQARGATPTTMTLVPGTHELRFEKAGRKTVSKSVVLNAGEQKRLSIDLENR